MCCVLTFVGRAAAAAATTATAPTSRLYKLSLPGTHGPPGRWFLQPPGEVTVRIAAPSAAVEWTFSHADTVLASGALQAGANRPAELRLTIPEVRRRALCLLTVTRRGATARQEMVIFPRRLFGPLRARLNARHVGVLQSLLNSQLRQDYYTGQVLLVAGWQKREAITAAMSGLSALLRRGACVVPLDPPAGLDAWALRTVPRPPGGRVNLAGALAKLVTPDDLAGRLPRRAGRTEASDKLLAWIQPPPAARHKKDIPSPPSAGLVFCRRIGRGHLVVSVLQQTAHPDTDPLGRAVLAGMLNEIVGLNPTTRP